MIILRDNNPFGVNSVWPTSVSRKAIFWYLGNEILVGCHGNALTH